MDVKCHKCGKIYSCEDHKQQGFCDDCNLPIRPEIYYHEPTGQWYHWDETYSHKRGPFGTYSLAENALKEYCKWIGLPTVDDRIDSVLSITAKRLKEANTKRGNAWEDIGLQGLFLEVRTMYLRLRNLVWDELANKDKDWDRFTQEHKKRVANCLLDLRAYATLAELAVQDDNYFGVCDDSFLKGEEVENGEQQQDT